MTTRKEALETTIYYLDEDIEVKEENLYLFIMESADECTSPRGVMNRMHTRENEETNMIEVWTWGVTGNKPRKIETFKEEEEAEEFIFQHVYEFDFLQDDQRPTEYFQTKEEAEQLAIERKPATHMRS